MATSDGHVALLVIEDNQFQAMCRAIERQDLLDDQRFSTLPGRLANFAELFEVMQTEIGKRTTAEIVERAHRFGMPLQAVNDIDSFLADPQAQANRIAFELEGPEGRTGLNGCLPLLAQFPILIGFYNMLTVAVELRGAPFFGWLPSQEILLFI